MKPTSALTANRYYTFDFVIGAFSGDTLVERVTITSKPVLVSVSTAVASRFTTKKNIQLKFDGSYSAITNIDTFRTYMLEELSKGINAADAFIDSVEIYSGSIIVEATIKSVSEDSANTALASIFTTVKQTTFGDAAVHGISLKLTDNCDFTITDIRITGQKTNGGLCYDTYLINVVNKAPQYTVIPQKKSLEKWAIALIVIGVLAFIAIVGLIIYKCMTRKQQYRGESARPVTWRNQNADEGKLM